jgi:asparagine synthase (glutamine-hydrolysing)
MCGIAGFWQPSGLAAEARPVLGRMTDALRHRGPDDEGRWLDPAAGIALGFRRLSILDLSSEGHQPMMSASGRYVIVFNGEIYNWRDLRAEEQTHGARWRGHSDTEVMLAAIERRGLLPALEAMVGMWAFALWDRADRRLHLVRDRIGEKPLYWGWAGQVLLFGSELKALRAHPAWCGPIDRGALALFLRHNYVPAPYSIYQGVAKAPPAAVLTFSEGREAPAEAPYWSGQGSAERGLADPLPADGPAVMDGLEQRLRATIRREMIADVPLGAFLSGGVDSSLVVALMQAESPVPVRTFTIGFREAEFNEARYAKAVAGHLGTQHTELYVTPAETLAVVPRLPVLYDEPFADSSQVPTFLVAELARQQVTVSLSGDGGDELFGGYYRYLLAERWWRRLKRTPRRLRRAASSALTAVSPGGWDRVLGILGAEGSHYRPTGDRLHKFADVLTAGTLEEMYLRLVSNWPEPARVVLGAAEPPTRLTDPLTRPAIAGAVPQLMCLDLLSYLPDDIMVKVDRAAMGVSLESRAPFLDHTVVEYAWRIPMAMKVQAGQGKRILRQLLYRHVPPALIDRPKMGFGVPIDRWLRGPLREWAGDLLAPDSIRRDGFFDPAIIERTWSQHLEGTRNWQYPLWGVLMFQAWLRAQSA